MSSPEVMATAHQMATDAASLAEETGCACFDRHTSELSLLAGAMLARASQSLISTDLLAGRGLNGDAMSCSRTTVELAIDFAYIAQDVTLISRFMAYGGVHHHKLASNVAKHGGIVPPDVLTELQRQRDEFKTDNKETLGTLGTWAGVPLSERASKSGRDALYNLSYVDQCNASHSGPGTLYFTQVLVEGELLVNFGPVEPSSHPIMLAVTALAILVEDATIACGLDATFGSRSNAICDRVRGIVDQSRGLARYAPAS